MYFFTMGLAGLRARLFLFSSSTRNCEHPKWFGLYNIYKCVLSIDAFHLVIIILLKFWKQNCERELYMVWFSWIFCVCVISWKKVPPNFLLDYHGKVEEGITFPITAFLLNHKPSSTLLAWTPQSKWGTFLCFNSRKIFELHQYYYTCYFFHLTVLLQCDCQNIT